MGQQMPAVPGRLTMATALGKEEEDQVNVLAHAHGADAGAMVRLAQAHDIPVLQDFALSSLLGKVPPGTVIPDEVFQTVGVLLEFLFRHEQILEEEFQQKQQKENNKHA